MPTKTTKVKKQVEKKRYNGGGFDERPQDINKTGLNDSDLRWRNVFMKFAEERKNEKTRREIVAESLWEKAENGDVAAFDRIADRMEGKAPQGIGFVNKDGDFQDLNIYIKSI